MKISFYQNGLLIYRFRWLFIITWVILLLISAIIFINLANPFKETGFKDPGSESARADSYINKNLGYSANQFIVLYLSKKRLTAEEFSGVIEKSLNNLKDFPINNQIIYPDKNNHQVGKNHRNAFAIVLFSKELNSSNLAQFKKTIKKPANMSVKLGGEPIFLSDTKTQTQIDLYKAEYIATPITLIILLIIFRSIIAAVLPIILGGFFVLFILTIIYGLGQLMSLSVFTINIALLLGLCINIDYALFIINRFRYELKNNRSPEEAIAITQATAGKAVFFSGLAVLISLSALLLFPINIMVSVGVGGIASVLVALLLATTFLPAVLGALGARVNLFTIPLKHINQNITGVWLVKNVVRYAWFFFFGVLILLFILLYPFFHVHYGVSDIKILPKTLESRQVFDVFKKDIGETKLVPISVMLKVNKGNILSHKNLDRVYDIVQTIKEDPRVSEVTSIVSTKPLLKKSEYYAIYKAPEKLRSEEVNNLLKTTTKKSFTIINVISIGNSNSSITKNLISKIRDIPLKKGMSLQVTGASANNLDVLASVSKMFIYAILCIIFFSYIILLIIFRSIILPIKAIILTTLSLCASYGVLVFIFQDGHLHEILNFEPQGILDLNLLIIIFCSMFGFSMDYEVFILTRIKEEYEKTGNNIQSIINGVEFSGKIITSAAIIVIFICFSFMFSDILIVQAFGLGVAIAIFVDAFLIRIILVPALMVMLGKWNWYLPEWLNRILPPIYFHKDGEFK